MCRVERLDLWHSPHCDATPAGRPSRNSLYFPILIPAASAAHTGVSTQIDYPGAVGTELNDINDSGMAVGEWYDAHGRPHPFKYDTVTATFKTLRPPGTGYARAWAINGHGLIALYSSDDVSSFIYCPKTKGCPSTGEAAVRGR
jgi:hypothetical protein